MELRNNSDDTKLTNEKKLLRSLQESEKEKAILLALSNEITSIRNKMELLPVLRDKFKKHSFYTDLAISLINEDGKTTSGYLIDWKKKRHQHPDYKKESTAKHILADGIFDTALAAKAPVVFNLEEIIKWDKVPSYIQFLYDRGIRDMIAVALHERNTPIGFLFLLSHQRKTFTPGQLSLLRGISQQLGTVIANIRAHEMMQQEEREKEFLLAFSYEIARVKNKQELLKLINAQLKNIFNFHSASIYIINNENETVKLFLLDPESDTAKKPQVITTFIDGTYKKDRLIDRVLQSEYPVVLDIDDEASLKDAPVYVKKTRSLGIKEIIATALRNEHGSFGFLNLVSKTKNNLSKNQLKIIKAVSNQISIAVANIISNETVQKREKEKSLLLSLSKDITSCQTREDILNIIKGKLVSLVHCDVILLCLNNADKVTHSNYLHTIPKKIEDHPDFAKMATLKYYIKDGFYDVIQEAEDPVIFDVDELITRKNKPFYFDFWHANNIKEMVGLSIRVNNQTIGAVVLHAQEKNSFNLQMLKMAQGVCSHIGIALSNIIAYEQIQSQLEEIKQYKSKLEEENLHLQEQIKTVNNYTEVVGASMALQQVFHMVSQVAASDSTVLILGETGTGKELIAKAIHNSSSRKSRMMIKVNCAALPSQLIESELFGHEKGSFTGATERRIGKFELANNSTLFLDEIGEMPLELQVKLLRVIQEKEIERVGGKEVIKTDVRIIVATNRNLQKEVDAGRFRSDLFYRLNVFPITLPPLRDRMEDIPVLVSHFINRLSRKLGKNIANISHKAMQDLMLYSWPGNVRELEHLIERSLLMTSGTTIKEINLPPNRNTGFTVPAEEQTLKSLEQNEREHILAALKRSNGRVRGRGGAAEILALPPTTLHSKMKKLDIKKTVS